MAQEERPADEGKLREKMIEFIQTKLSLNRAEAEQFQPLFVNYFKDLKQTNREYKGRGLELQQKIVELRLHYRDQFKPILGEKRSNEVFDHEREFVRRIQNEIRERRQDRKDGRANKRIISR